jgi:hypothetical protein
MAYYSVKNPKTYHNCKNCNVGDNIVKENQRKGKPPGAVLCITCFNLNAAGKGIPGIPKPAEPQPGAKVETYFSSKCPEIFHICQNCFLGQNIEKKSLVEGEPKPVKGRGGKIKRPRLCKVCTKMCILGKCKTGTPILTGVRKPRYPASKIKLSKSKPKSLVSKRRTKKRELVGTRK